MSSAAQVEELVRVQKEAVMAHRATDMAAVEDPAERFGQSIRGVDRARDMLQNNIALIFPFLNGKMLDVNMPGADRGFGGIHHEDSRFVVLIQHRRAVLHETEFSENRAEIFRSLGGGNGGDEFGLG